jgi:hypothetical protein
MGFSLRSSLSECNLVYTHISYRLEQEFVCAIPGEQRIEGQRLTPISLLCQQPVQTDSI